MITREKKDGRLKLWSVEGKRSDNNGREGRKIKVSCGVKRGREVMTKEEEQGD